MKDAKVFEKQAKPVFQKLAGGGFASALPIRFRWKANWYQICPSLTLQQNPPCPK
jgi:hypothetical protein